MKLVKPKYAIKKLLTYKEAKETLTPKQRKVLELTYEKAMSRQAVADEMKLSRSVVSYHLAEALVRVKILCPLDVYRKIALKIKRRNKRKSIPKGTWRSRSKKLQKKKAQTGTFKFKRTL